MTSTRSRGSVRRAVLTALGIVALLAATAAAAFAVGRGEQPSTPGDHAVEASFARAMSAHHAQAVEMAEVIRRVTTDEDLQLMATDIALTQQSQIGQMRGWLQQWQLPVGAPARSHEWMNMDPDGPMPGMATKEDVGRLSALPLAEAEVLFLQLMIEHHRGGVEMAEAVFNESSRVEVRRFAEAIVSSQQSRNRDHAGHAQHPRTRCAPSTRADGRPRRWPLRTSDGSGSTQL